MVNYGLRCLSVIKNRKSGITLFSRPNKYFGPILVAVCFVITLIIYTPVNEFILLPQLSMHRFPIVIAKNFIYLTYSSLLGTYIHCSVCACSFAVNYGIAFFWHELGKWNHCSGLCFHIEHGSFYTNGNVAERNGMICSRYRHLMLIKHTKPMYEWNVRVHLLSKFKTFGNSTRKRTMLVFSYSLLWPGTAFPFFLAFARHFFLLSLCVGTDLIWIRERTT